MKKTAVLNSQLSGIIAAMGHTDMLTIADVGLPVPLQIECVDLAVTAGLPRFLDVLKAVAAELEVERLIVAEELWQKNPSLANEIQACFPKASVETITHNAFKKLTHSARAIVRTGETTPYANVILCSGVTF